MKLNTENPNCFEYKTDELVIELLGGVRIDTLDRMRVTVQRLRTFLNKAFEFLNIKETRMIHLEG